MRQFSTRLPTASSSRRDNEMLWQSNQRKLKLNQLRLVSASQVCLLILRFLFADILLNITRFILKLTAMYGVCLNRTLTLQQRNLFAKQSKRR